MLPDLSKVKRYILSIFEIIDRKPLIDFSDNSGKTPDKEQIKGAIEIKDAEFFYPARPDIKIFNSLNIFANPGENIAIVGPSGCGKSTVVSILERFYDLTNGYCQVENINVKGWQIKHLRNQMSLVSQESVLFNDSIRENIAYGHPEIATDEDVYGFLIITLSCCQTSKYSFFCYVIA